MEYGLGIFLTEPPQQLLEMVRLAEERGFSHVWIADSHVIWREPYVTLGAAAVQTKRVILGTGVTNPVTRDLSVTASAFATLSELTGGRVALGIGLGDSAVETMGKRPAKLAKLEESIGVLRRLLSGQRVTYDAGEVHMDWVNGSVPPIFIGASGPRILRLAGKVADGAIILVGVAPEFLQGAFQSIQEGAQEAGRDPAELEVVVRANLMVIEVPTGDQRYMCTGSPDEIKADIAATRELGVAELHFDPSFSPDGVSLKGFLKTMEQMKQLADEAY